MTSEQYKEIRTVLFGKEENKAFFAGINADLSGVRYAINGQSGTVTDEQAKYLAKCLKEMSDTLLSEGHKERPANEEPISLFIKDDAYDCRVDFYSTGEAFNKKMINSTNEITERAYMFNPIVYSDIKNILAGLDDIPCPVDIADMDGTLLKCTFDDKCNVYHLDKEQLKQLQSLLENCKWKPELYTNAINSSAFVETSFYNNSIVLKNKDQFLFIYSGGMAIYSDKNRTPSSMPDVYHIDGIDKLISDTKAMNSKMTSLNTNELINRELDICLSEDTAEVNIRGTDYPYTESGRKIPTARLREVFEGLEWEEMEFKEYDEESDPYSDLYSQYDDEDGTELKLYVINETSIYKVFYINSLGTYTNQETGRGYRCTEPEKVAERLDKLYEEYKK